MKYIIWIENGVVSMARIAELTEDVATVDTPVTIVTMQYGVDKNGQLINPNDQAAVRTKFVPDMLPYLMNGFVQGTSDTPCLFKLNLGAHCYTICEGDELPIIQKYISTVEVFNTAH